MMTHEQFCRYLVLLNAIPQAIVTLGMRMSITSSAEKRTELLQVLTAKHSEWQAYKKATKAQCNELYESSEAIHTAATTAKYNGK